ncbi:hypothetical protein QEM33_002515 [Pseudomonas putida]|uniref:Uncharacterized protein n=1 Tax=Pseudomonas putida TaxID=303 RepID=A0A1X0ZME5_PSEPU|nr:hypothetical protein [Pseudomonas putida]EKT4529937.1 hypothetical protein [Pseudomonas putida]ORL58622.1 hypothetical protein B7H17_24085 [Pseudomonas putida]
MESLAEIKQTWSPFQFPSAPLSALTIPKVTTAVQSGISDIFMRERGYLVDLQGHSAMCLEALQGGLLNDSDLSPLEYYPNGYGLHLVTKKVVKGIESKIVFSQESALPDASRIVRELARVHVDISFASGIALAVAEAGLLHDSTLAPIINRGPDCGYDLLHAAKDAVDALWPEAQRIGHYVHEGEVHTHIPFYSTINGTDLHLDVSDRNCFYLDWPELSQEYLEIHILLSKTLDAMNTYIMPFHTPASAFGCWGQYSFAMSESYEGVKEDIAGKSQQEIVNYLLELADYSALGWLADDLEIDEDGSSNSDALERVAAALWQIDDVERNFTYRISHNDNDQVRKAELSDLLFQSRAISTSDNKYSALAVVLVDALESCLRRFEDHVSIDSLVPSHSDDMDEVGGYETSPNRFYDCVWVLAGERHERLHIDAVESLNSEFQEYGPGSVVLPLSSAALVAQVTIPIMERTNEGLALLRRIQLSLEEPTNA